MDAVLVKRAFIQVLEVLSLIRAVDLISLDLLILKEAKPHGFMSLMFRHTPSVVLRNAKVEEEISFSPHPKC